MADTSGALPAGTPLARDPGMRAREEARGPAKTPSYSASHETNSLGAAAQKYTDLYMAFGWRLRHNVRRSLTIWHAGPPAKRLLLPRRGTCWHYEDERRGLDWRHRMLAHDHAIAVLVEHGRSPETNNPARAWCETLPAISGRRKFKVDNAWRFCPVWRSATRRLAKLRARFSITTSPSPSSQPITRWQRYATQSFGQECAWPAAIGSVQGVPLRS